MNNQINFKHKIIEYLLSPLKNNDIDFIYEENQADKIYLSQNEQLISYYFQKFIDEMPGGFFIYRADGNEDIIYANKSMLRIFNCNSMEEFRDLTGNSFRGIVHPDDLESVELSIKEQIKNSKYDLDYVEYRIIQKGGKIRWIDDYGHFIHSDIVGNIFYVFVGDSTDKKKLLFEEKKILINENIKKEQQFISQIEEYNQKLKIISEEQLRRLEVIEGLSIDYEAIFYVNLDTDQIKAYRISQQFDENFPKNQKTFKFTNFDSHYIENWVYPDDRKIFSGISKPEYIRAKLSTDKTFHINYRIFKENKITYMQLRVVNISNDEHISQIIIGYRNVDNEIIQEMKQKQIIIDALDKANLANNAKNLFLSNMSHDMRTPMNAITGFTELAKKNIDDREKVSDYLEMISVSSNQLLQLINDILEISRIKSSKIIIKENECNLLNMLNYLHTNGRSQAKTKNITISLDTSNLKHNVVYADIEKIHKILFSIIDNAIKYTKPNGQITIIVIEQYELQNEHIFYQFIVKDNGIGISETFLKNIFEPFEREQNTTLGGVHGTGLGLAITKNLVDMLGGIITVSSIVGEGSKFTVTLPLRINDKNTPLSDDIDNNISTCYQNKKRILIVDDNEINLEIENELLKNAGFYVDTASDGNIAVKKIKHSKPGYYDLILMDIQMPIMNGYTATKEIRKLENTKLANIPIIAVSANTFDEDKKTAIESGMNAHLSKPLNTSVLYKLIQKFLNI